ncbi:hypothetical protein ACWGJ9_10545 [Curtobacterium citreum]
MPRLSDTLPLPDQSDTVVLDDAALFGVKPFRPPKRRQAPPVGLDRPVLIDVWQVRVGLIVAVAAAAHLSLGSLFHTLTPATASIAIEGVLVAIVLTGWGAFRWRDAYVAHRRGRR